MRYTLIETFDGREVLVPNEQLVSARVTNWTYSNENARVEVRATITYQSDAPLAQRLMLEAAQAHPRCKHDPAAMCTLKEFTETGLLLALNFWVPDVKEGRGNVQSEVMMTVLDKFRQHGIDMARTQAPVQLIQDAAWRTPPDSQAALK